VTHGPGFGARSVELGEELVALGHQTGSFRLQIGQSPLEAANVRTRQPGLLPIDVVAHRGVALGVIVDRAVVLQLGGNPTRLTLKLGDLLIEAEQLPVDAFQGAEGIRTKKSVPDAPYVRMMRPETEYRSALDLIAAGINDSEIGRRLEIPRGTIRDWRFGLEAQSGGRTESWSGSRDGQPTDCFRCTTGFIDEEAYSYLFGVYLGDGCLSPYPRGVYRLRIACDLKYPDIINEIATHIVIVRGVDKVGFTDKKGCVEVSAYWKHWICLFPQHAPGRKHERKIELDLWQGAIVTAHPKAIIRGLIQSDGNRHINEVPRKLKSGVKRYRYSRYMFTNASTDILGIFTASLDLLDVHWTQTTPRDIAVSRRKDVAFLDTFVGPKS